MHSTSLYRAAIAAAAILAGVPAAASAAPFTNGGFEDPNGPKAPVTKLATGSTAIPGWVVSSGNVEWLNRPGNPKDPNRREVGLMGSKPGSVSQIFDTIPGAKYTVTFAVSFKPGCPPHKQFVDVSADGSRDSASAFPGQGPNAGGPGPRRLRTFTFTADDGSATLTFAASKDSCAGAVIDDVTVSTASSVQLLDSRSASNAAPATITTARLAAGQAYTVRVRGTFSPFAASLMAPDGVRPAAFSICGVPEDAPQIPSPDVENGRVGADAEYLFAYPQPGSPCNPRSEALLPLRQSALLFSTDNGATFAPPVADGDPAAPTDGHVYSYSVTGTGQPLQVRFADRALTDNYGQFEITLLER